MAGQRTAVARPVGDQELAQELGAQFGLGPLEGVARLRPGVAADLVAGCRALLRGRRPRPVVTARLFRYSGGLAQLTTGEPEPRVARWGDVTALSVFYAQVEDEAPRLDGFIVTVADGPSLTALKGFRRRGELRALVHAAEQKLAPLLLPALSEAYDAGEPVSFGRLQLSQDGITVGYAPAGQLITWPQVRSVHMTYINPADGDYVDDIIIGRRGATSETVYAGGLSNGIFLPAVLARAAAAHRVVVTGYHGDGGGIPAR